MQILTDYHMHSTFSPDGDDPPIALCQRALELGLEEIAITEHAEWYPHYSVPEFPKVAAYFEATEQCRIQFEPQGLHVYAGVELGNPHQYFEQATALLAGYPFDVTLASLHWLYGKNIHLAEVFEDRDPYQVYTDYFIELGRLAAGFDFDILAHFDRILWRGILLGIGFEPHRLEPVIRDTLAIIVRYSRVLELNTSHVADTPNWNEALVTILHWFLQEGGTTVVVNSDAHRIGAIARHQDIAINILRRAGFDLPAQLFRPEPSIREAAYIADLH